MAKISNNEISEIRSSANIIDIVSSYVPLTKRGKNYFGVCPFHDDSNPSMSVSEEKQIYTCFSCGATGNVFNFIMDYENISFIEALNMVATKVGYTLDAYTPVKKVKTYEELYKVYDLSNKFYQNNINSALGKKAKEYLLKRDINDDIIKRFGIGLSLRDRKMLTELLLKKGHTEKTLVDSGLVSSSGSGINDIYYNRIMFPLHNLDGEVVGFSGRIYEDDDQAKYINTKETNIFKKGELLYNYHVAKEQARRTKIIYVMEGFMDVIAAYKADVLNVIATMGTAVTSKQANLIKRLNAEVVLCFDGDAAGVKATLACADELIKIGVTPKVVMMETGMDPDEYISKYGKEAFISKLESHINVMEFKLKYYKKNKNMNDTVELAKYVDKVIADLELVKDDTLREITISKLSDESGLPVDYLKSKLSGTSSDTFIIPKAKLKKGINKYEKAEQYLIYYMLKSKEVIKMYKASTVFITDREYRELANEVLYFYQNYGYINLADLMSEISDNKDMMKTISTIVSLDLKDSYSNEEILDYINVIRQNNVINEMSRLDAKLKGEISLESKIKFAQRKLEIKRGESNGK